MVSSELVRFLGISFVLSGGSGFWVRSVAQDFLSDHEGEDEEDVDGLIKKHSLTGCRLESLLKEEETTRRVSYNPIYTRCV